MNVAARLERLAEPGGVVVSGTAYDHLQGKLACGLVPLGERRLKNIGQPVRVFRVALGAYADATAPPPLPDKPSIAVLPFDNLGGAGAQDFEADGLVDDLITGLSRFRTFAVVSRNSAYVYKGRAVDARQAAGELGVRYLLTGSVRRAGDRVRITAQLIEGATGVHLWAEKLEGKLDDIFEFQDRIASHVAGAIHPALLVAEIGAATRKPPDNLEAYHLVLRAYPKVWSASKSDNAEAISLLGRANALDPSYGRAHALLAWCHAQNLSYMWSGEPEWDRKQVTACVTAASPLIDDDPMALTAVGAPGGM